MNGTWKYFLLSLEPVHDDRGNLIGIIGASLDLTEQREIEIKHHEARTQMEIQRRLMEQREKDRQAIAREIHDGPVQTLVSTLFNVQFAKEAFPDPELRVELEQISLNLKNAVQELRQVINELRPPSVIRFGLKRAIEFHAEDFREKHQEIELSLNLDDDENRLTELNCLTLYRIYQEAIVNVARHAAATRVQVLVELGKDTLVMEIRDNGRGFDMTRDVAYLTQSGHFGMAGMRERAEAINGALSIRSEPGKGTTVRVEIPLPGQSLPKTE